MTVEMPITTMQKTNNNEILKKYEFIKADEKNIDKTFYFGKKYLSKN